MQINALLRLRQKIERIFKIQETKFVVFFLLSTIAFSITILILSILIDPRGLFGTNLVKPITLTNRTEKMKSMAEQKMPLDILIFGSSRLFKMDPLLIEQLSGLKTYNASVSYARPEEHWSMLQYILNETAVRPKIILVGLHHAEFNNDPTEAQTIMSPLLRKYLPISRVQVALTAVKILKDSFSPLYLRDMFLAIFWSTVKHPEEQVTFDSNGYQNFDKNRAKNFARINQPPLALFNTDGSLHPERKVYFKQFADLANKSNLQVIVFITPMPEEVIKQLTEQTTYETMRKNLLSFLGELAAQNKIILYDFSRIQNFNGLEDGFDDSTHPSYQNMDLIAKKIFYAWPKLPASIH